VPTGYTRRGPGLENEIVQRPSPVATAEAGGPLGCDSVAQSLSWRSERVASTSMQTSSSAEPRA
jgi:hypothetical protein